MPPRTSNRRPVPLAVNQNQQLNSLGSAASFSEYELEVNRLNIRHADDLSGEAARGFLFWGSDGTPRFLMNNGVNSATGDGARFSILSALADATTTTGRTSLQFYPTYWDGTDSEKVRVILRADMIDTTPTTHFTIAFADLGDGATFNATVFTLTQAGALTLTGGLTADGIINDGYTTSAVVTKYKAADETVNNDVNPQTDDDLKITGGIGANEVWAFEFVLHVLSTSTTPGFRIELSAPTDATAIYYSGESVGTGGTSMGTDLATASLADIVFTGTELEYQVKIKGMFIMGATANGAFSLRWAQETAHASDTKVKAGSHLIMTRLA